VCPEKASKNSVTQTTSGSSWCVKSVPSSRQSIVMASPWRLVTLLHHQATPSSRSGSVQYGFCTIYMSTSIRPNASWGICRTEPMAMRCAITIFSTYLGQKQIIWIFSAGPHQQMSIVLALFWLTTIHGATTCLLNQFAMREGKTVESRSIATVPPQLIPSQITYLTSSSV
jgi:hypothetical protein